MSLKIIYHSDLYVPLITPGGVPGVLYEPVFQASGFISAIADYEHTVVDWIKAFLIVRKILIKLVAIFWIDDTASVWMNIYIIGGDSDADRLFCNGGLQLFLSRNPKVSNRLYFDVNGLGSQVETVGWVVTTTWSEWVVPLEHGINYLSCCYFDQVTFIVIEGIFHVATVATLCAWKFFKFICVAVNELLFRKGMEFSGFNEVGTLESPDGGEGPAWATSSLIFDWGDSTGLNPIDIIGKIGVGPRPRNVRFKLSGELVKVLVSTFVILIILRWDVTLDGLVFSVCPVGELVLSEFEVTVGGVVLAYERLVVHKSLKARCKLSDVHIDLIEAGGVFAELKLVCIDGGSGRSEGGNSER